MIWCFDYYNEKTGLFLITLCVYNLYLKETIKNLRYENSSLLDALIKFMSRIFFSVIYPRPLEITLVSYEIKPLWTESPIHIL